MMHPRGVATEAAVGYAHAHSAAWWTLGYVNSTLAPIFGLVADTESQLGRLLERTRHEVCAFL